jgi:HEPN domain-containing protein
MPRANTTWRRLEQHYHLMLKYKLLLKTSAYPRMHSLIKLVRELARAAEGPGGFSRI